MTVRLSGVLTALATPFGPDGALDRKQLCRLIDRSVDGGVDGLAVGGSTGEFAAMTGDERRALVETVVEHTAGRVPVVAQTGAVTTREAVALSRHAEAAGASVAMVIAPYYETLTMDETLTYFRTVADAVGIPVMLYNMPGATGVNLDPDTVGTLAGQHGNIRYVKDSGGDMSQASRLIHQYGDTVSTFVGWDTLAFAALVEGAAGVMAGTANVVPAELVSVWHAVRDGDLALARERWHRIHPFMDAVISAPSFIPAVKAALQEIGLPAGAPRRPQFPVDEATRARLAEALAALPHLSRV
ncbi:dihydrodipicolinate synthase family protein [Streptomyces sp. NPDC005811]|uniref:dihydrodipicolinate synthase family protein n=1 Tax=Streptomyces sp. NPDC005811 TaxID=3154565 RepID=UPI0033DEED4F